MLRAVNMLIATAQNNLAMNRTVRQLAMRHLDGAEITEGLLNRIEAGHPLLRPVPLVLHARAGPDAAARAGGGALRAGARRAMALTRESPPVPDTLVIGIGNPLRGDDGAGAAVVGALPRMPHVRCLDVHQLLPNWQTTSRARSGSCSSMRP